MKSIYIYIYIHYIIINNEVYLYIHTFICHVPIYTHTYICHITIYTHTYICHITIYSRRQKNLPLRSGTTYFYFLSVTVGGAFSTVFLSFLGKRTVLGKRTILPIDYDVKSYTCCKFCTVLLLASSSCVAR